MRVCILLGIKSVDLGWWEMGRTWDEYRYSSQVQHCPHSDWWENRESENLRLVNNVANILIWSFSYCPQQCSNNIACVNMLSTEDR